MTDQSKQSNQIINHGQKYREWKNVSNDNSLQEVLTSGMAPVFICKVCETGIIFPIKCNNCLNFYCTKCLDTHSKLCTNIERGSTDSAGSSYKSEDGEKEDKESEESEESGEAPKRGGSMFPSRKQRSIGRSEADSREKEKEVLKAPERAEIQITMAIHPEDPPSEPSESERSMINLRETPREIEGSRIPTEKESPEHPREEVITLGHPERYYQNEEESNNITSSNIESGGLSTVSEDMDMSNVSKDIEGIHIHISPTREIDPSTEKERPPSPPSTEGDPTYCRRIAPTSELPPSTRGSKTENENTELGNVIKCRYCGAGVREEVFQEHTDNCLITIVKCKYVHCNTHMQRRKILFHEEKCTAREVLCKRCGGEVQIAYLRGHLTHCNHILATALTPLHPDNPGVTTDDDDIDIDLLDTTPFQVITQPYQEFLNTDTDDKTHTDKISEIPPKITRVEKIVNVEEVLECIEKTCQFKGTNKEMQEHWKSTHYKRWKCISICLVILLLLAVFLTILFFSFYMKELNEEPMFNSSPPFIHTRKQVKPQPQPDPPYKDYLELTKTIYFARIISINKTKDTTTTTPDTDTDTDEVDELKKLILDLTRRLKNRDNIVSNHKSAIMEYKGRIMEEQRAHSITAVENKSNKERIDELNKKLRNIEIREYWVTERIPKITMDNHNLRASMTILNMGDSINANSNYAKKTLSLRPYIEYPIQFIVIQGSGQHWNKYIRQLDRLTDTGIIPGEFTSTEFSNITITNEYKRGEIINNQYYIAPSSSTNPGKIIVNNLETLEYEERELVGGEIIEIRECSSLHNKLAICCRVDGSMYTYNFTSKVSALYYQYTGGKDISTCLGTRDGSLAFGDGKQLHVYTKDQSLLSSDSTDGRQFQMVEITTGLVVITQNYYLLAFDYLKGNSYLHHHSPLQSYVYAAIANIHYKSGGVAVVKLNTNFYNFFIDIWSINSKVDESLKRDYVLELKDENEICATISSIQEIDPGYTIIFGGKSKGVKNCLCLWDYNSIQNKPNCWEKVYDKDVTDIIFSPFAY